MARAARVVRVVKAARADDAAQVAAYSTGHAAHPGSAAGPADVGVVAVPKAQVAGVRARVAMEARAEAA